MNNVWTSIIFSLVTGIISSSLVVIYFEIRQNKRHKLSRAHILERFTRELFGVLTVIRVASQLKLNRTSFKDKMDVVKDLELILGRNNPSVLIDKILNLSTNNHQYIYNQLVQINNSLFIIFSHSIAHKTIEDEVSASIAEMQEWISSVLQCYITFPEIIENKSDNTMQTMLITSISNLVENTFSILTNTLKKHKTSEGLLRWGSHSS